VLQSVQVVQVVQLLVECDGGSVVSISLHREPVNNQIKSSDTVTILNREYNSQN